MTEETNLEILSTETDQLELLHLMPIAMPTLLVDRTQTQEVELLELASTVNRKVIGVLIVLILRIKVVAQEVKETEVEELVSNAVKRVTGLAIVRILVQEVEIVGNHQAEEEGGDQGGEGNSSSKLFRLLSFNRVFSSIVVCFRFLTL